MTIPTDAEIRTAYDAIVREGPGAEVTIALGLLVMKNPCLRTFVDRVKDASLAQRGIVAAALLAGLNYGLRIGEARANAAVADRGV